MAKVSDIAKEKILADLAALYPDSKLIDKKFYANFLIEGEEVQIAITLTAPKTKVEFADSGSEMPVTPVAHNKEQLEKEVDNIFDFFKL